MPVQYDNALKDLRMTDVITKLDGAGTAVLEIWTASYGTLLVSIPLESPSFTEANQQITLAGTPLTGNALVDGQAAMAQFKDGAGAIWISGLTVGMSGADIIVSSTSLTADQAVTISSFLITHG